MFERIDHQPGNNQPEADGLRRRDQVLVGEYRDRDRLDVSNHRPGQAGA